MKTENYEFYLEGPEISEIQTLQRDLQLLKNILKELNKVNHRIGFVIDDCNRAIEEIKKKIQDIAGESYLKTLEEKQ